ncbi:AraC family transcriptional regulator [Streptomyces sp. NPDC056160]|uniref:AraC-like ligand-binding domain-containing protein n=1 Tax=Streptomyces sp. NPDC056160 TaxID=3345731 RepID=UPI0035D6BDA4
MNDRTYTRWSSSDVGEADAFAYWSDVVCDTFVGVVMRPGPGRAFEGRIETSVLDGIGFAELAAGAQRVARTRRLIARDDEDVLLANIQLRGRARLEQNGQAVELAPGEMAFADSARPYTLEFTDVFSQLVVKVPRSWLPHRRSLSGATAVELGASGPGRVVVDFLVGLNRLQGADPAAARALLPHAVDLLGAAVSWAGGAAPLKASAAALARERVLRFVRGNITDPGLDAAAVAAGCGVSRRTVYRALAEDGVPLTELIRGLRVSLAQRLVSAHPDRTLAAVAHECGFGGEA